MEIKITDIDKDTLMLSDESIDNDNFVELWTETFEDDVDDEIASDPILVDIEQLYAAVGAFVEKRRMRIERESEIEFQESCSNLE